MRCFYVLTVCALIVVCVNAHLHGDRIRLLHEQMVPFGTPFGPHHNMLVGLQQLPDPFLTSPGLFGGGILTQGGFPNVVQLPQTTNNQLLWNNGIPSVPPTDRNDINNNILSRTDPWEQYRRFNNGVQRMSGGRRLTSMNSISSSNYPWNTFATRNIFGTDVPTIPNNKGFVSPQFQSNVNQFQNQGFQSQGFPNNNQFQNQGLLTQGFPNNNQFQNQGFLSQGFPNNNQFQNQGSLTQRFP